MSISYQVGGYPKGGYDFELTRKVSALVRGTPLRFVAIYVCYSASPWQRVADLISHLVEPILRVRLRSVMGKSTLHMLTLSRSCKMFLTWLSCRFSSRMSVQVDDFGNPSRLFPRHESRRITFGKPLAVDPRATKYREWNIRYNSNRYGGIEGLFFDGDF